MNEKTYRDQYKASLILIASAPWCALVIMLLFPPLALIVLVVMVLASIVTFIKGVQLQQAFKKSK